MAIFTVHKPIAMNNQIERIIRTRKYLIEQLKDLPIESLNRVPEGFNNNIVWNLGHLIAAQQGICYVRAGANMVVDEKYYLNYKPGTKPEQPVSENEAEQIKSLLITSLDGLEADIRNGVFEKYTLWTTRYGVDIANIDDALQFLMFHEGLHSGTIIALKRLVTRS
jgi:hypothetical protein